MVSPIGSGDAFAGGTAAGLAEGLGVVEAATLGCACAVANALTDRAGHMRALEAAYERAIAVAAERRTP